MVILGISRQCLYLQRQKAHRSRYLCYTAIHNNKAEGSAAYEVGWYI